MTAFAGRRVILGLAAARAAFLPSVSFLVDRRPGATLGFILGHTALLVAFLDVFGLAFLFVGIAGLISARHSRLHCLRYTQNEPTRSRFLCGRMPPASSRSWT